MLFCAFSRLKSKSCTRVPVVVLISSRRMQTWDALMHPSFRANQNSPLNHSAVWTRASFLPEPHTVEPPGCVAWGGLLIDASVYWVGVAPALGGRPVIL